MITRAIATKHLNLLMRCNAMHAASVKMILGAVIPSPGGEEW